MPTEQQISEETASFFRKVYAWMCAGLALSAATAYYVSITPALAGLFLGNKIFFYALIIIELALVLGLVLLIKKIRAFWAVVLFFGYCFVTGLTLSVIFLVFTIESIGLMFLITAGMFGAMSAYGFLTKSDLTGIGSVLIMGLFGVVIGSIVNLFLRNSVFDLIITIIGVIVFTGLTAYDTQKIKKGNKIGNEGTEEDTKESIMGALTLYLDFVNLFLNLLKLFGKRR